MEWKSNLFTQNVRGILRFEKRWSRPRFSLARGNEITLIQRFRAARLFPSAAPRSMDRGFSAGFPFLAGRRRGESLVPAGSLSFTFHAGREPRGRKRPAASHGCTTKLARRVPVSSSSSPSPYAWDDSTILYLAPTSPSFSVLGLWNAP